MISQELKHRIFVAITEQSLDDVSINNPVILLDKGDDPWVIDEHAVHLFELDEDNTWWSNFSKTEVEREIYVNHVTAITIDIDGIEVTTPSMITKENDPDFIEQVKMALMMRNL